MNVWKLSTVVLVTALGVTIGRAGVPLAAADSQPHMDDALRHLKDAKAALEQAVHDKGGHREKALSFTDQAIKQVEAGIAYADKH
jgi:hypothetical protein